MGIYCELMFGEFVYRFVEGDLKEAVQNIWIRVL
jgi:hypothetical protein